MPSDHKDALKSILISFYSCYYQFFVSDFLRAAAKANDTPIDYVFGGVKLNTVICRECFEVSTDVDFKCHKTSIIVICTYVIHTWTKSWVTNTYWYLMQWNIFKEARASYSYTVLQYVYCWSLHVQY